MTEDETVNELICLLVNQQPFVHVRFGDGDVFFATGTGPKITGDGEEWCEELSGLLRLAWKTLAAPRLLLLGDLRTYQVSDGCEAEWDQLLAELVDARGGDDPIMCHMEALRVGFGYALPFYECVDELEVRKCFIGPERLRPISERLGCEHIDIPLHVSWHQEHVARVLVEVMWDQYDVALFAAGRGGKLMQSWLGLVAPELTQIDVGSGLDLLIDDGVRRGTDLRVNRKQIVAEYREAGLCP